MRPLVSPLIAKLPRYVPGKSIEAVKRELGLSEIIKLASNESPFGPSPKAMEAMRRAMNEVHRYPDDGTSLREELGGKLGVRADQLLLGAGATDLIELCVRAFGTPDGHALISNGSFVAYKLFLLAGGIPFTEIPLAKWDVDLDALAAAAKSNTQLLFLANPNNPTGSRFGQKVLDRLVAKLPEHVVLVLDDAYRDYDDEAPDTVAVIARRPRTVVLRSFSKVHGLAGMRVGYAVAAEELIGAMAQVQRPFPVSRLAMEGARAALTDVEHVERTVERTRVGRAHLQRRLRELGFTVLPSHTNFVTLELASEADVTTLTRRLLERGFIIRPLASFGMPSHARISVGTERELELFLNAAAAVVVEDPALCGPRAGAGKGT
jgi:histidinol-phosphate aminotransferase